MKNNIEMLIELQKTCKELYKQETELEYKINGIRTRKYNIMDKIHSLESYLQYFDKETSKKWKEIREKLINEKEVK